MQLSGVDATSISQLEWALAVCSALFLAGVAMLLLLL